MTLVLLLMPQGRTAGGHGLLEAVPRIYQVTPDIPDRRRAKKKKQVRPYPGRQPQRESARRRWGPSPQCRTSPTTRITTASLEAVASAGACTDSRRSSGIAARRGHEMRYPRVRMQLV